MSWIIIVLIVVAVLLLAGLVWTAMRRKRDQLGRQRADELRSEAAATAAEHPVQEARAREAEAEAERARARADQLQARAQEERTAFDQSQAHHEDRLREADRVDPDVTPDSERYADLDGRTQGEHVAGERVTEPRPGTTPPPE